VAKDSTHDHINISLDMVIPALLLARWWALGGWEKRLCVEEWAEGERGGGWRSEDSDWRVRGRMDEEMGNEYTEISDRSKGGVMIELTMTVLFSPHIALLSSPRCVSHHIFMRPRLLGYASAPIAFIHTLLCPLYCHHRLYPSHARKNTRTLYRRRRPNSNSANPS
jgi:hypothetical protein